MLDVRSRGRIGIVSINRPERRNAMDRDLVAALVQAFLQQGQQYRCRADFHELWRRDLADRPGREFCLQGDRCLSLAGHRR